MLSAISRHYRKPGIGGDHQKNGLHHADRGLSADAVSAAAHLETLIAAHWSDDGGENRRLTDSDQERRSVSPAGIDQEKSP